MLGILENITEAEMKIAMEAIQKDREEKSRLKRLEALEVQLLETVDEIYKLKGSVHLNKSGRYIPVGAHLESQDLEIRIK